MWLVELLGIESETTNEDITKSNDAFLSIFTT
jgi:hypothetical protein